MPKVSSGMQRGSCFIEAIVCEHEQLPFDRRPRLCNRILRRRRGRCINVDIPRHIATSTMIPDKLSINIHSAVKWARVQLQPCRRSRLNHSHGVLLRILNLTTTVSMVSSRTLNSTEKKETPHIHTETVQRNYFCYASWDRVTVSSIINETTREILLSQKVGVQTHLEDYFKRWKAFKKMDDGLCSKYINHNQIT